MHPIRLAAQFAARRQCIGIGSSSSNSRRITHIFPYLNRTRRTSSLQHVPPLASTRLFSQLLHSAREQAAATGNVKMSQSDDDDGGGGGAADNSQKHVPETKRRQKEDEEEDERYLRINQRTNDWLVLVSGVIVFMGITYYITSDHFLSLVTRWLVARYIRTNHDFNRRELIDVFGEKEIDSDENLPLGLQNLEFESASGCLLCGGMTLNGVRLEGKFVTDWAVGTTARDPQVAMALSERSTHVKLYADKIVVMVPWKEVLSKMWRRRRYQRQLSKSRTDGGEETNNEHNQNMPSEDEVIDMYTVDIPLMRVQGVRGTVVQNEVKNVAAAAALNMSLKSKVGYRVGNLRVSDTDLVVSNFKPGKVTAQKIVPPVRHEPVKVSVNDMVMMDFLHTNNWLRDIVLKSKMHGTIDSKPFSIELYRMYMEKAQEDAEKSENSTKRTQKMIVEEVSSKSQAKTVRDASDSSDSAANNSESREAKIVSMVSMHDVAFPSLMRLFCPTFPITAWFKDGTLDGTITTVEEGPNPDLFDIKVALKLNNLKVEPTGAAAAVLDSVKDVSKPLVNYMNRERTIDIDFFVQPSKEYLQRRDGYRAVRQILLDIMFKEIQARSTQGFFRRR